MWNSILANLIPFWRRPDFVPEPVSEIPKITILVVDDEEYMLDIIEVVLKEYRVLRAGDGEEGWKLMQKYSDEIKLVICDYMMPGMNGIQLLRMIRGAYPKVARILCSGVISTDDLFLYNDGYHEAITKPFDINQMQELVAYILSDKYIPKTEYTRELRQVVAKISDPPSPELKDAFVKMASMTFNF